MHVYRFCYRLTKELNMALDNEGHSADAFAQITIETEEPVDDEKLKETHEINAREQLAYQSKASPAYIIPISNEEYDAEHEEEV